MLYYRQFIKLTNSVYRLLSPIINSYFLRIMVLLFFLFQIKGMNICFNRYNMYYNVMYMYKYVVYINIKKGG